MADQSVPPIVVDPDVRRSRGGRSLLGGSPLRLLRVTEAGAALIERFDAGEAPGSGGAARLARRLLDAGMADPAPTTAVDTPADVALVVPVRDDADGLRRLLRSPWVAGLKEAIVVDDGSRDRAVAMAAVDEGAALISHIFAAGPGAARNRGWRSSAAELIAFVDADCLPADGWLDEILRAFADPAVVAAAPEVNSARGINGLIERYEAVRSPLDLGGRAARIAAGTRVPYAPGAALVVRRSALEATNGFDESLSLGEDVDLVWRLGRHGTVRYWPSATAEHRARDTWGAWARQRFGYGTSAAPLDRRHPGAVAPAQVNVWSAAAWSLAVAGGRRGLPLGVATAAVSAVALVPKLRGRVDRPVAEAARLGGLGHLYAGGILAAAIRRAWLPIVLAGSVVSRRIRRVLVAATVVPALVEWARRRPEVDPVRWTAISVADDAAYCAGVWAGCRARRSWRALRPRLTGIPGVTSK